MKKLAELIDSLGEERAIELLNHFNLVDALTKEEEKIKNVLRSINGYRDMHFENVPDTILKAHNDLVDRLNALKRTDLYE